jgi:N-acetylmuramoyl-L-alanine amidase
MIGLVLGAAAFGFWWWRRPDLPPLLFRDERPLIVVDAGHGGVDGGTQGFGVLEKEIALSTAVRTARELRQRGMRATLTRTTDTAIPLEDRARMVNNLGAAALVSVHFNFTTASSLVRGVETFYSDPKELSAQRAVANQLGVPSDDPAVGAASTALADAIRTAVCTQARTADRGTRNRPDLAVTRRTHCPAVLVECAYLSNPDDAARAATPTWQASLAQGITNGIMHWSRSLPFAPTGDRLPAEGIALGTASE